MGKIYTGQDKLILYISTGSNLAEVSSVYIHGEDPSGVSISPQLTTTIEDRDTGLVSYEVQATDFTEAGTWTIWVYVAYTGGAVSYGEPFHLHIYTPGS